VSRSLRGALWTLTFVLTATGIAYVWLRSRSSGFDDEGAALAGAQAASLHGHILAAPLLVFVVGWIFATHALARLSERATRRPSGVALLVLFAILVSSGTLLQVASAEAARAALAWIHGLSGAAWVLLCIGHALGARRARAS
jgi:hypothetical protein